VDRKQVASLLDVGQVNGLVIPGWGLIMMFVSSVLGSVLLFIQLSHSGWKLT